MTTLVLLAVGSVTSAADIAAQQTGEVVRGGANASADSMGLQIVNAGASLGWTFGRSTAAYRDITATAEGKSVDLGALEALLGQPQCGGEVPPALDLETLPPRTIADSTVEGSEVEKSAEVTYPRLTGDTTPDRVVGTQRASARRTPASHSATETLNQDFGPFRIEGARSSATTSFEGGVRTATAEASADRVIILGGQVIFNEPRWSAMSRSGAETASEAAFSFRSARVFGNFVSGSVLDRDLAIFETVLEGVLSPLGLDLRYPEVRQTFGATGIEVTPLAISMADAPIGKDLLTPLLNTEWLANYRIDSVTEDCRRETFWTIVDALERALGGSGSIEILVGGAVATTDDTDYSFEPFEDAPGAGAPAPTTTAPPPAAPPMYDPGGGYDDFGTDFDDFGGGFSDGFDSSTIAEVTGDVGGIPDTEVLATESTAPPDDDGAVGLRDGREIAAGDGGAPGDDTAALVVGVLALVGALGLSMGDRIVGLRARRRIS